MAPTRAIQSGSSRVGAFFAASLSRDLSSRAMSSIAIALPFSATAMKRSPFAAECVIARRCRSATSRTSTMANVAGGMVTAVAQKMDDVELTQFTNEKNFSFGCGPRARPDTVYLTWRREETPVAGRVGVALALEFLPRGYVP